MDKVDEIVATYPHIWKTRSAFFSWLKGIFRKGWSKHPARTELLKKQSVMVENTNPRSMKRFPMVAACRCSICGEVVKKSEVEVDHILEETASLTEISDIQSCVEKLLLVSEKDLRIVCKPCHSIHTLSQKLGITFEEARVEQLVISMCKNTKKCLTYLESLGYSGDAVSNQEKRRKLLRELLSNGIKEK